MPIKKIKFLIILTLTLLSLLSIGYGIQKKELQKLFINASATCYSCIGLE